MPINLTDRQKEAFRQLVARKDELHGNPFNLSRNVNARVCVLQLDDGPEFEFKDFNEYVKAGLLDQYSHDSYILTNLGEAAVANDFRETGILITDLKDILLKLYKNLNELRDREAKFGGQAPVELLNKIDDHKKATSLVHRLIDDASELQQELDSLNIADELKARLLSIFGEK